MFTAARPRPLLSEVPEVAAVFAAEPEETGAVNVLRAKLSGLSEEDQERELLGLVRKHAAAVLGYAGPDDVDASRAFRELGFDSLTAIELRNRLTAATGLKLSATLVFDYPNATTLARVPEILSAPVFIVPRIELDPSDGETPNFDRALSWRRPSSLLAIRAVQRLANETSQDQNSALLPDNRKLR